MASLTIFEHATCRQVSPTNGSGATREPVTYFYGFENHADGWGESVMRPATAHESAGCTSIDSRDHSESNRRNGRRVPLFTARGLFNWLVDNNWLTAADAHAEKWLGAESICGTMTGKVFDDSMAA